MKKATLAALATSLCAATSAHSEKPIDRQTELIVNLAVITASVDRCHFEIDSRIRSKMRRQVPAIITTWRLRSRRPQPLFKGLMTRIRENGAIAHGATMVPTA
jgi:hypothetical protein